MPDLSILKYSPGLALKNFINLSTIGLDIIKKHGFRAFLVRLNNWLFKKPLDTSQIPLVDIPITSGNRYYVEKSLSGSFLFPADNLFEIRLFIVDKEKDSKVTLLVRDDEGRLLREISLDNKSIKVNGFTSFRFKPIPNSREGLSSSS